MGWHALLQPCPQTWSPKQLPREHSRRATTWGSDEKKAGPCRNRVNTTGEASLRPSYVSSREMVAALTHKGVWGPDWQQEGNT